MHSPAWTPPFQLGEPAPWFEAAAPGNAHYHVSTSAGRYVLLAFLPDPGARREAALAALAAHRTLFDDHRLSAFLVARDAATMGSARQEPGVRWFFDADGRVSRLYGAIESEEARPYWLLLDPMLRVIVAAPMGGTADLFDRIAALPSVAEHAGVELYAPALIVPRVFEADICKRLIALYAAHGGSPSGVMRDVGGRTVGVLDGFKRRRDVTIDDEGLRAELVSRLSRRLAPEIARAYQFQATRIERYIVACYDAADGGFFRPHRDNETLATQHRKFAVSINLNAEEFEGGDLRFPEFGPRTYRPPTGGAVVFACGLLHEATPVTRGRRYAFLPFLYDEAGQVLRDANAAALA
ncbi:2OG-Fe(II) oxygenase [Phenylobacterium sp.]|uniref:2OG-Fe(II) oxygenase family protein n=1 Tax=Phenylobacterium sp. TaxID=1871053 RepID=UPI00286CC365|nr:2OG-Fe(II) oxygenase [Phenylobacterium sp.]